MSKKTAVSTKKYKYEIENLVRDNRKLDRKIIILILFCLIIFVLLFSTTFALFHTSLIPTTKNPIHIFEGLENLNSEAANKDLNSTDPKILNTAPPESKSSEVNENTGSLHERELSARTLNKDEGDKNRDSSYSEKFEEGEKDKNKNKDDSLCIEGSSNTLDQDIYLCAGKEPRQEREEKENNGVLGVIKNKLPAMGLRI